ncbi:MAG: HD domain-containing protein, partial [Candidatus Omnitrophica bacterium]|nr:HD domain-containing protein [Candidatus Omnitrophota bacterium]
FNHAHHVAHIAEEIAKKMGFNEDDLLGIRLAGELHDLGKMSIPLDILNKPGKLSSIEYALIQEHVQNCYELIKDIDFPFPLAEITYQHHERLDGTGYPRKLKGDQILREARILAVSDVLEAMTHRRPYRESLGITKACEELIAGKGIKYDTEVVSAAINIIKSNPQKEFWLKD